MILNRTFLWAEAPSDVFEMSIFVLFYRSFVRCFFKKPKLNAVCHLRTLRPSSALVLKLSFYYISVLEKRLPVLSSLRLLI